MTLHLVPSSETPARAARPDIQFAPIPVDPSGALVLTGNTPCDVVDARYRLRSRIGDGRSDHVYLADDGGESVVVKILGWRVTYGWADRLVDDAFDRRCERLQGLRHVAIARTLSHGIDEEHELRYITSELVYGTPLPRYRRLLGRPLTVTEAATMLKAVAEGLAYCESHGVSHGRLTPASILVVDPETHGGTPVKVVGFGVPELRSPALPDDRFQPPFIMGHMPDREPAGPARCDVFAIGAAAYFLTAGTGCLGSILTTGQKFGVRPVAPTSDERWNALIRACLDTSLGVTAAEVAVTLDAILEGEPWTDLEDSWFVHGSDIELPDVPIHLRTGNQTLQAGLVAAAAAMAYVPWAAAALLLLAASAPYSAVV